MGKKRIIGLGIFLIGIIIFTYPFFLMVTNDLMQINKNNEFENRCLKNPYYSKARESIERNNRDIKIENTDKLVSLFEKRRYSNSNSKYRKIDLEKYNISLNEKMGYISIPKLGQSFDLFLDADYYKISKGVAVLNESDPPIGGIGRRCVIAGHSGYYNKVMFKYIDRLEKNDIIIVNFLGRKMEYEVYGMEIISPMDWKKLEPIESEDVLTLLTCTQFPKYNQRLLVNCKRVLHKNIDSKKVNSNIDGQEALIKYLNNENIPVKIKIIKLIPYIILILSTVFTIAIFRKLIGLVIKL